MTLEKFYDILLFRIDTFLSGRYWLWKLIAISVGLSLFLAFPPYNLFWKHLSGQGNLDAWTFIYNQSQNLLQPEAIDYDIRRENMIMRWTLPVLSMITGHNLILILALQALMGVFFIYWIGKFVYRLTEDKILTTFLVLSVSHTFVGIWHFAEVHGYGDGIAYFCLLGAMLRPKSWVVFPFLLVAFFTDERAVFAGGFVLLWNITNRAYAENKFDPKNLILFIFTGRNGVVWLAWIIYFAIRFYVLSTYFPTHDYSTIGHPIILERDHKNGFGSSYWTVFEACWMIILGGFLSLLLNRRYFLLLMLLTGLGALLFSGIYVHDIDRSLAYGFAFILISFVILHKENPISTLRPLLFFCMVACIIEPQVFYMGYNKILWLEPFPLKILQFAAEYLN